VASRQKWRRKGKKPHNSVNTIRIELLSTDMEISSIFTSEKLKRKKKYYFFFDFITKIEKLFANLLSIFPHAFQILSLSIGLAEVLLFMLPRGICLNHHGC
jgi:hypothetical protein